MTENNKKNELILEDEIDKSLNLLPLEEQEEEIINQIIEADTKQELEAQFDLFNMNQSKKNALRIIKLQTLLEKVEDQAIERFERRPDQVSNRELLDYMQVVSSQIDRSQKSVDSLYDRPVIKAIQKNNTEVNINVGSDVLDRDSKEKVIDAVQGLLKQIMNPQPKVEEPVVIPSIVPTFEAKIIHPDILEEEEITEKDEDINKNIVLYSEEDYEDIE